MKQNKAFSLLEIVFTILIISTLLVIAMPYFQNSIDKSSFTKLKTELLMIQNGINQYNNKQVISSSGEILDSLEDEDNTYLFSKILPTPIVSNNKNNSWEKLEENMYIYRFSNNETLLFKYDSTNARFMCDTNEELCKEVLR